MTYFLYNTHKPDGTPNGRTSIFKIEDGQTLESTLAYMPGVEASDVRTFDDNQFTAQELYFDQCFEFGNNNDVTFNLDKAKVRSRQLIKNLLNVYDAVRQEFPADLLLAQSSLPENDRLPAIQQYFDDVNQKVSSYQSKLNAIDTASAATTLIATIEIDI